MTRSGCLCVHSWFNSRNMEIGVTRASLYFYNTEEEIEIFLSTLEKIMRDIKKNNELIDNDKNVQRRIYQ